MDPSIAFNASVTAVPPKLAPDPVGPAYGDRGSTAPTTLIRKFRRLTGRSLSWPALENLSAAFLATTSLSPAEILAAGLEGLSRRTVNVLRRSLIADAQAGRWTYQRLIEIRRFGFMTLLEVLDLTAGLPGHEQQCVPTHRRLEEELGRLLARTRNRAASNPTPVLDQAVAVIVGALPTAEAELERLLHAARLIDGALDVPRLERALRFRDAPCPFVFFRRPGLALVVARDQLQIVRTIHQRTLRALRAGGTTTIDEAAWLTGIDDVDLIRKVLSAKTDIEWLDHEKRGFRLRPMSRPAA